MITSHTIIGTLQPGSINFWRNRRELAAVKIWLLKLTNYFICIVPLKARWRMAQEIAEFRAVA